MRDVCVRTLLTWGTSLLLSGCVAVGSDEGPGGLLSSVFGGSGGDQGSSISITSITGNGLSNSISPLVLGATSDPNVEYVQLFKDSGCSQFLSGDVSISLFGSTGTTLSISAGDYNTTIPIYALGRDAGLTPVTSCMNTGWTYTHDNLSPTVTITSPLNGDYINTANISSFFVTGTCSENGVQVDYSFGGGAIWGSAPCSGGSWSATRDLTGVGPDGAVAFDVMQTDLAGNMSTMASVSLNKDTTAPTAPVLSSILPNSPSDEVSPVLTGMATGGYESVSFFFDSGCSTFISGVPYSTFTGSGAVVSVTPYATTSIYAISYDLAGNPSSCTFLTSYTHELQVKPVYPANGANWNDYIAHSNTGVDMYSQTDTACLGTETGARGPGLCLNGGLLRKVRTAETSCAGLSLTDNLGAFNWTCKLDAGKAVFYTVDLKPATGLSALVTPSGWINNQVALWDGVTTRYSQLEPWWSNPVVDLSSGGFLNNIVGTHTPQLLNTASAVYVLGSDQETVGYQIAADKVSVVMQPGVWLSFAGDSSSNCNSDGSSTSPTQRCVLYGRTMKYVWIEGRFSTHPAVGTNASHAVALGDINFSRLHRAAVVGYGSSTVSTIRLSDTRSVWIDDLASSRGGIGIHLFNFNQSWLTNAKSYNNMSIGVLVDGTAVSPHSRFSNILVAQNPSEGFFLKNAVGATISRVTAVANGNAALPGIRAQEGFTNSLKDNIFHNILSTANGGAGVEVFFSVSTNTFMSFDQVASLGNGMQEIKLSNASNQLFTGNLLTLNTGSSGCIVSGGTSPGVTHMTCAPNGMSVHSLVTGVDPVNSFVGAVSSNDSANSSDSGGVSIFEGIALQDWIRFDNPLRTWAMDLTSIFSAGFDDSCGTGSTCQIWDWRLSSSDFEIRNVTGDGSSSNASFSHGAACPTEAYATSMTHSGNTTFTGTQYLTNAVEVLGDFANFNHRGDDDGLCESSEACIYTPNFGVYQGEGAPLNECIYSGGSLTNIRLLAHPTNGG